MPEGIDAPSPATATPLLTVNKRIAQGRGLAGAMLRRATTVELDWDTRCRSRYETTDSAGRRIGVFLPRGQVVRGGDVLVADDGSLVVVKAAPQQLLAVRHCAEHGAASDLLRAAYHLGNRHVAVELQAERLQLEPDHVLAAMLRGLHLIVDEVVAPFEPEAGAYQGDGHGHGHGHSPGPARSLDHDHGHDHGHGHGHGHGDGHPRGH